MPHTTSPASVPRPAYPSSALSLRQRIAPKGADVRLMEIVDTDTGLPIIMCVDVTSDPRDGEHVVVTNGIFAHHAAYRADVPVPDDLEILGIGRAIVTPI